MLLFSATIAVLLCASAYAQFTQCVCVMTSSFDSALNVRDAPVSGNIIGQVYPNECMYALDGCPGGWCQVRFGGQTAYVSQDFVSGPQICGDPAQGTCLDAHCGTSANNGRTCDAWGCGHYGAPRGSRAHYGSDVRCSAGVAINAPFDGYLLQQVRPYGDGSCCDDGYDFVASGGVWQNFKLRAFYANGYSIGASTSQGQRMATHIGLQCGCYDSGMTDHSHVEIYYNNNRIDPTSFLYCNYK